MLRLKQKQDRNFTPSQIIESFLREYLQEEFTGKDIEKEKLEVEEKELQERLALIKMQKEQIEKVKEDADEEWYRKRGMKKKDAVDINLEAWK